jgi:DNA processing protein
VYPKENKALYSDVSHVGALISEYPPQTRPLGSNFPERNRIMSGISLGVVVVEAPEKSGALITASRALEQGRDVFAVPGNVDAPSCKGSNALLREGAIAVMSGDDVMAEYKDIYPYKFNPDAEKVPISDDRAADLIAREQEHSKNRQKETKKIIDNEKTEDYIDLLVSADDLSPEELTVAKVITEKSMHVDDIIEKCGLPASEVLSVLTLLEINGAVTQESGKRFTSHVKYK